MPTLTNCRFRTHITGTLGRPCFAPLGAPPTDSHLGLQHLKAIDDGRWDLRGLDGLDIYSIGYRIPLPPDEGNISIVGLVDDRNGISLRSDEWNTSILEYSAFRCSETRRVRRRLIR